MVGVHSFKNFINKNYQLYLTGKAWPESMLVWINNIILISVIKIRMKYNVLHYYH